MVRIGDGCEVGGVLGTLDGHLRKWVIRATAGRVAVVLEEAGVVGVIRGGPVKVRLT